MANSPMHTFKPIFALGFESTGEVGKDPAPAYKLDQQVGDIDSEHMQAFRAMVADFARDHLGLLIVDRRDPSALALASTLNPVKVGEPVQWDQPLFCSDGFQNSLVVLGARDVITMSATAYVVWDRLTGKCKMAGCEGLTIGNSPLSEQETRRRHHQNIGVLRGMPQVNLIEISPWINDGHCSLRCIVGSDPGEIANRVAFIEKTPRVRVAPYTTYEGDSSKWSYGYKGSDYGKDTVSRAWCDEQLEMMGYRLSDVNSSDVDLTPTEISGAAALPRDRG